MCGIHGFFSNDTYVREADSFMKDAFVANQLRGTHSSGIFVVGKDKSITTHKLAVCGQDFLKDDEAKSVLGKVNASRVSIGHVRHATAGGVTDDNAHPFLIERADGSALVGVHNGTLRNWKQKKNSKDVDVDSAWAFQMLANEGFDAFEYFDGAFAFVWYDSRTPDILYMARNNERPLHYMVTESTKSVLVASELGMLGWLAERNKIAGHKTATERFRYLSPGHIYKFDLKNPSNYTAVQYPKYDSKHIIPPVQIHHGRASHWNGHNPRNQQHHSMAYYPAGYDGDWEDWDGGNNYPFAGMTEAEWKIARDKQMERDTTDTLSGVASALMQARTERLRGNPQGELNEEESTDVSEEDISREVEEFIKNNCAPRPKEKDTKLLRDKDMDGMIFLSEPNTSKCTQSEVDSVRFQQLLGGIVDFTGILYDTENSTLYGTTRVFRKNRWYDVEAELRGIPQTYADHKYVNAIHPERVVLIGYNPNMGSGSAPYYIVEELTQRQQNLLRMLDSGEVKKVN